MQADNADEKRRRIALLATGSELLHGDALNTAGARFSTQLFEQGFKLDSHIVVSDCENDIKDAIAALLGRVDTLIITGGLGPTSDDRTRFALSAFLGQKLVFHPGEWERINKRFNNVGKEIHESNRQQTMFPAGAQVLPNPRGTAAGCLVEQAGQVIFMLPGPPRESFPMFDDYVMPLLHARLPRDPFVLYKWKLLGGSEGEVASAVDKIARRYEVETGYRWSYPYLDVKIYIPQSLGDAHRDELLAAIRQELEPLTVSEGSGNLAIASRALLDYLNTRAIGIHIDDTSSGGALAGLLLTPANSAHLFFSANGGHAKAAFRLEGLDRYWKEEPFTGKDAVRLYARWQGGAEICKEMQFNLRGHEVRVLVAEFASFAILKFLQEHPEDGVN